MGRYLCLKKRTGQIVESLQFQLCLKANYILKPTPGLKADKMCIEAISSGHHYESFHI